MKSAQRIPYRLLLVLRSWRLGAVLRRMRRRRAARSVRARMRRCVRVLRSRFGAGRPIRRVRRLGIPALTPVYCRPRTPLHQAGAYSGPVLVGVLRGMARRSPPAHTVA